jgi:hypothetical protein
MPEWDNTPPVAIPPAASMNNGAPTAVSPAAAPDNTAPSAIAAAASMNNGAPSAIAAASAPDNTAPTAIAPAAAPDNTAPVAIPAVGAMDNGAPTAIPAASSPDNTAPTAVPAAAAMNNGAPAAIDAASAATGDSPSAVPPFSTPTNQPPQFLVNGLPAPIDNTVNTPQIVIGGALVANAIHGQTRIPLDSALTRIQVQLDDPPNGGNAVLVLVDGSGTPISPQITVLNGETLGELVLTGGAQIGLSAGQDVKVKCVTPGATNPGGFGAVTLFLQLT